MIEPPPLLGFDKPPEMPTPTVSEADAKLIAAGASWFNWIGILSVLNSVLAAFGSDFGFAVGFTVTSVFDAMVLEKTVIPALAIGVSLVGAVVFAFLGSKAKKGRTWAFLVGLAILIPDTLLAFIDLQNLLILVALHLWAIWQMMSGARAAMRQNRA